MVTDSQGYITDVNPSWTKALGWTREETLGKRSTDFMIDDEAFWGERVRTLSAGQPMLEYQTRLRAKDGHERLIKWTTVPEGGTFYGFGRDITAAAEAAAALADAEAALRQSQKMEAVGQLTGGIAHDFNNLMMVVIGHAHRLLQQLAAHPAKREIDLISQAGMRAAALTKKLLTFSRRQVFEPKELDINTSIRDMEDLLQRLIGEHVQMVVVLHPNAGHAMMDPVQLEQILMNLAVNARDAMPDGGLLNIETDCVEIDDAFVRLHPGSRTGSFVKILVQDAGCGMDADTLSHIFEPFFTTKGPDKGTGLGLATVYGILKQSQGYIDVTSRPGQGTRFTVYLPRVEQPGATVPVIPTAMTPVTAKETVLLVEDDDSIRTLMATVLQDQGYHVLVAGDGIQALQQLQLHKGPCHLVVTDVIMPRMKSSVLVEGVKVMQPTARILYMSGYAGETLETSGIHEDTPFLQKPFLPSTLIEKVQEILKAEQ